MDSLAWTRHCGTEQLDQITPARLLPHSSRSMCSWVVYPSHYPNVERFMVGNKCPFPVGNDREAIEDAITFVLQKELKLTVDAQEEYYTKVAIVERKSLQLMVRERNKFLENMS